MLNGKATHFHYPSVAFWSWNDPAELRPARINAKRQSAVYTVGFPSVFQTSEALRFDLAQRPRKVLSSRPVNLGIGHTVHASKFIYNSVASV